MRTARKLTLLAMLAIAATALASTLAFAQVEPLAHNQTPRLIVQQEIHNANDTNCPAVTPSPPTNPAPLVTAGGCRLHVASVGDVVLTQHLSAGGTEIVVTICNIEFDVRVDAAGEGFTSHQEFVGPTNICTRRPCGQGNPVMNEGRASSFYAYETEPEPRERSTTLFCTENHDGTGQGHCEVTLPTTNYALHRGRSVANDVSSHGVIFPHCEFSGNFDVEAAGGTSGEAQGYQNVEVRHT